jgi:hypothetical protein
MFKQVLLDLNNISEAYNKVEDIAKNLKDLMDVQCAQGNWDYSPYMMGLANGLILADSLMTKDESGYIDYNKGQPDFKSKPKNGFLEDKPIKKGVIAPEVQIT